MGYGDENEWFGFVPVACKRMFLCQHRKDVAATSHAPLGGEFFLFAPNLDNASTIHYDNYGSINKRTKPRLVTLREKLELFVDGCDPLSIGIYASHELCVKLRES